MLYGGFHVLLLFIYSMIFCYMWSLFRFYLFLKLQEYSSTLWQKVSSLWIHLGVKLLRFMWVYYQSFYATCDGVFYDVATLYLMQSCTNIVPYAKNDVYNLGVKLYYYKMRPQWAVPRACIIVVRGQRVYGVDSEKDNVNFRIKFQIKF